MPWHSIIGPQRAKPVKTAQILNDRSGVLHVTGGHATSESRTMEQFVHEQNLLHFRKLLLWVTDGGERRQIKRLLAEEEAKGPVVYAACGSRLRPARS